MALKDLQVIERRTQTESLGSTPRPPGRPRQKVTVGIKALTPTLSEKQGDASCAWRGAGQWPRGLEVSKACPRSPDRRTP